MKRMARLTVLGALAALAAAGTYGFLNAQRPYKGFKREVFYDLKRGTGTLAMARDLASLGVVRSPWHFMLARLLHPRIPLQAGEYRFEEAASAARVLERIARGEIYYVELTIPEGSNLFEISQIVHKAGLGSAAKFRKAASDPSLISDLAPSAQSLEGYLYPSTYEVSHKIEPVQLCRRLTGEFRKVWTEIGGGGDPHQIVTLASLVEKETGVPEERARVAGVYRNRLEAGIKLQCDPTVIYSALLLGKWRGTIYRSDLDRKHPYNTYRFPGLPPGPIASPGRASLEAALRPDEIKAIYFVARPDGSGRHVFSETHAAHGRAVASYRRETARQRGEAALAVAGAAEAGVHQ